MNLQAMGSTFPVLTTSFSDILKSSYLENVTGFNALDMVIGLGLAFILGLFIAAVYKKTFVGVMYSSTFCISLISMTLITTFVILAITSNVVLSLGMVGALSIVRYRSAIKEPIELSYLFWATATGIVVGAGMIPLAVFGSLFIGIVLILFVNKKPADAPYILVVQCENDTTEKTMMQSVIGAVKKHVVKSKTVSRDGIEVTMEIRLKDATTEFVSQLLQIEGVKNAVLVSYNGEYMS